MLETSPNWQTSPLELPYEAIPRQGDLIDWWVNNAAHGLRASCLRSQDDINRVWQVPSDPRQVTYTKDDGTLVPDSPYPLEGGGVLAYDQACFDGQLPTVHRDNLREHVRAAGAFGRTRVSSKLTRPPEQALLMMATDLLEQNGVIEEGQSFFKIKVEDKSGPQQVREMPYSKDIDLYFAGAGDVYYALRSGIFQDPRPYRILLPVSEKNQFLLVNRRFTTDSSVHEIRHDANIETVFYAEGTCGKTVAESYQERVAGALKRSKDDLRWVGVEMDYGLYRVAQLIASGDLQKSAALVYYSTWSRLLESANTCGSIRVPGCRFFNWCYAGAPVGMDPKVYVALQYVFIASSCALAKFQQQEGALEQCLRKYRHHFQPIIEKVSKMEANRETGWLDILSR